MRHELVATGVATVSIAAVLSVVGGSPAAAGTAFGCVYPRVCLYQHSSDWTARKPTDSYRTVTPDWQRVGPRGRHAYAVFNSRNDDAAWLLNSDGTAACVEPNETWFFDEAAFPQKVVGIKIVDEPDCFGA
jgi:hypothetical protein